MSTSNRQKLAAGSIDHLRFNGMNLDGTSERPGSSNRGSRSGSQTGSSPTRGRAGSVVSGSAGISRPRLTDTALVSKRVDLPADAFRTADDGTPFTKRPGFNSDGRPIKVQLNLFPVKEMSNKDIYQYDVNVSPNPNDHLALVNKVWHSQAMQSWISSTGAKWLFDGHKLAWCSKPIPRNEVRLTVDLDREAGRSVLGRSGVYYVHIRQSTMIRMEYLRSYLQRKSDWDSHVLECMNFLDHLLRQWPGETMQIIKRNFYPLNGADMGLDAIVVVRKGTYSAFKLGEVSPGSMSNGLVMNMDVANTAFWQQGATLAKVAQYLCTPHKTKDMSGAMPFGRLADALRPQRTEDRAGNTRWVQSDAFKNLRRIHRLKFTVTHRGKEANPRIYTVKRVMFDERYGPRGADSLTVTFSPRKPDGTFDAPITIFDYYLKKYGARIGLPDLPLVETEKDGYFPLEACKLIGFQRYAYKLDPDQTAAMIKIAVSRPNVRKSEIMKGVQERKWSEDPYLQEYGVKIQNEMIISNARVIQNPEVHFAGGQKINPNVSGRWDLRNKRFIEPHPKAIESWGFIGCGTNDPHTVDEAQLKVFAQTFVRIFKGHGGTVKREPFIKCYPYATPYPEMCSKGYTETGNFCKAVPQILFFVTSTRNMLIYERLKKNMDCRLCTVSQMLQADHVKKNNMQYCSNVAMKVNAKLGGSTCKALPVGAKAGFSYFSKPTMIVGLDVSHGHSNNNNEPTPSMAALSMSIDKTATKYCANVQTNGWRQEIVTSVTMRYLFDRLMKYWVRTQGCVPKHVYYFRDGVSQGEFIQVLEKEVKDLKRMFREANYEVPLFTVLIATKRHHIRMFPKPGDASSGDKNNNPLPGTIVEHDATHPFHWDFFLASHVAIQGTARPVHYHVLLDEANCDPNMLQKMIYHQCYQYVRSATPVSLHPAVYYSHLASNRARAHEDVAGSNREIPSGKEGFPLGVASAASSGMPLTEAPSLVSMEHPQAHSRNVAHINTSMWYV
ncbi:Piwi domain-containing protein [Xylariales sp. PMI_506]|nr:Piwi domain-containing protein [Xylariales sp. PMI_506]